MRTDGLSREHSTKGNGWIGRVAFSTIFICFAALPAVAETIDTRFGQLEFEGGYPTAETVQKLYNELDFQRAVQA